MPRIISEIHIVSESISSDKPLPNSPFPFNDADTDNKLLTPSTQLLVHLAPSTCKPDTLANLADGMDETRARLNEVLTMWKDWAGKEGDTKAVAKKDNDQGGNEDEDEEEEEE